MRVNRKILRSQVFLRSFYKYEQYLYSDVMTKIILKKDLLELNMNTDY